MFGGHTQQFSWLTHVSVIRISHRGVEDQIWVSSLQEKHLSSVLSLRPLGKTLSDFSRIPAFFKSLGLMASIYDYISFHVFMQNFRMFFYFGFVIHEYVILVFIQNFRMFI